MNENGHRWNDVNGRRRFIAEQFELGFDTDYLNRPLPKIMTLREFVDQLERDYGPAAKLENIRAAMREPGER